jgi:23S rRNA (cytosine1962-C5)-methyltransferase
MFSPDQYELLDFGQGRKLERFGGALLDRPAPAAARLPRQRRSLWEHAVARFERRGGPENLGRWQLRRHVPTTWTIHHGSVELELRLTHSGSVGVFPEQAENWDWIDRQVRRAARPLKILNLFAYTAGSTLAAAAAGGEVVHVDAARSAVAWARQNAERSGLASAPIRWITEDVAKFARRELKRGRGYDAVILDPPSYGHGPRGQSWNIERDLSSLLRCCSQLTRGRPAWVLLTCHSRGFKQTDLKAILAEMFLGRCQSDVIAKQLAIRTADGRRFFSGMVARWPP